MKRWISLLLVLSLCLSLAGPALAAEPRETAFFTHPDRSGTDFADMTYEPVDVEAEKAKMDAVRTLAQTAGNEDAVREGFLAVMDAASRAVTMSSVAYIQSSLHSSDQEIQTTYQQSEVNATEVYDAAMALLRDLLHSPCASALDTVLTEEEREAYANYVDLTPEQKELNERITALVTQFWILDGAEYTADYEGTAVTAGEALQLYLDGTIDYDTYLQLYRGTVKNECEQAKGPLFLELVELRKQLAASYGYDNYAEFTYHSRFFRDFTLEEAAQFEAAVKEYVVPLFLAVKAISDAEGYRDVFTLHMTGEEILDLLSPYFPALSTELQESFEYMRAHGLYDIEAAEDKSEQGFTTLLFSYDVPFFYSSPVGGFQDLTDTVHELGHYNNYYYEDNGLFLETKATDIAEVHSQTLELLFTRFYSELFGQEEGQAAELAVLTNLLNSILTGAMFDEFQQYIYSTDDLTVSQLSRKYRQLAAEYGFVEEDDPRTEMYGWSQSSHTFETPMYMIAYAVSAAGAFSFWLESQTDFYQAVDDYLRFTALPVDYFFQESFETVGMDSPLSTDYIRALTETLYDHLDVEARLADLPVVGYFRDVKADDWFVDGVDFVYYYDLMTGTTSPAVFAPRQEMTRGELVTILHRACDTPEVQTTAAFSDVEADTWYTDAVNWAVETGIASGYGGAEAGRFGPKDLVTREQLATILARFAQLYWELDTTATTDLSAYADYDQASSYARDALGWAVEAGILTSTGTGGDLALSPQRTATRAEAAVMLLRFYTYLSTIE